MKTILNKRSCFLALRFILAAIFLVVVQVSFSQQYSFTNYSVEQGLSQSQPTHLIQDKKGFIWIATLGGLSRFDGVGFHNYTKADGLLSLLVSSIYAGNDGKIWIGTQDGIQSYDGRRFRTYDLPSVLKLKAVADIAEDEQGIIYFRTVTGNLFHIQKDGAVVAETGVGNFIVTSVAVDNNKKLYAAVYKQGIYQLAANGWQSWNEFGKDDATIITRKLFFSSDDKAWVLTNKGIYSGQQDKLSLLIQPGMIRSALVSIEEDASKRIWIGTTKGTYIINPPSGIEYVGGSSGLTDNTINDIIRDRENNLWFATDGDGIYKLINSPLTYFTPSNGLNGNIVMAVAADAHNNIWFGTAEAGLQQFDGTSFTSYTLPSQQPEAQKTNSLLIDRQQQLWIGTLGGGLWKYKDGKYVEVLTANGNHFKEVVSIYEDSRGTIWVCVGSGVFYYQDGTMHKVDGMNSPCFSVVEIANDTMLIGSAAGLWQLVGKKELVKIQLPGSNIGTVNCFAKWKKFFLLGTEDAGIIFWDRSGNKILQCSSKNGLSSDFIFSVFVDSDTVLFAGTGHGVSKIIMNEKNNSFNVKNYTSSNNLYGPECNLNAIQRTTDGKIWVGTTKGLVVYNNGNIIPVSAAPLIYLKSVQLFSNTIDTSIAGDTIDAWTAVPNALKLSHRQNHLTFEFTGLYLTNPSNLVYHYKLEGADTGYSTIRSIPKVIYSNLPPGTYHFKAFATTDEGVRSSNSIDFAFTINAPFYQTTWFKVLAILTLIGMGIFIQYSRTRLKIERDDAIKKIRLEEQLRIQERTSEDLHDDLGNKITRIAVLADVLQNKIDKQDAEKNKLVSQIKENAQSLYVGTKDIIWSLTPGNDNLYDILERCRSFGIHLFEDTDIEFKMEGLAEMYRSIILPITLNRNLVMITKEAFNNILKHSAASKAIFKIEQANERELMILISDNGKGIGNEAAGGNGLNNIRKRLERIDGKMELYPTTPTGTTLRIYLKIPPKEG